MACYVDWTFRFGSHNVRESRGIFVDEFESLLTLNRVGVSLEESEGFVAKGFANQPIVQMSFSLEGQLVKRTSGFVVSP